MMKSQESAGILDRAFRRLRMLRANSGSRSVPGSPSQGGRRSIPLRMAHTMVQATAARKRLVSQKAFEASPKICTLLQSIGQIQAVPRSTTLFRKGDAPNGVFVILKGKVALSAGDHGCEITRIATAHSLLGLPSTVGNRSYTLTAETVTDVELCVVPGAKFRTAMASNPELGMAIVTILSDEVSALRRLVVRT